MRYAISVSFTIHQSHTTAVTKMYIHCSTYACLSLHVAYRMKCAHAWYRQVIDDKYRGYLIAQYCCEALVGS